MWGTYEGQVHNLHTIRDLEVELEIARIEVPSVDPKDALVHGRITDPNLRGISGLTVFVKDEVVKAIRNVEISKTDASGYYALKFKSSIITGPPEKREVFLAVRTKEGKEIFNDTEPFGITKSAHLIEEVVFNREDLSMIRVKRPVKKVEEEPAAVAISVDPNIWTIWGIVTDNNNDPVKDLILSLYDKDLIFDDILGTTKTDGKGNFIFRFETKAFRDLFEKKPDIYIKVMDENGKNLYTSKKAVRLNVGQVEEFNIQIE